MGAYQSAENPDRAKAIAGVALVHVALGALILSGLTVSTIAQKSEALKVFDAPQPIPSVMRKTLTFFIVPMTRRQSPRRSRAA